jgi:hypothetical protein
VFIVVKAHAVPFDEETFTKLSPDERISFAVSCLQTREQLLENFSYKLVIRTSIFEANGGKEGDLRDWKKKGDLSEWRYTFIRSGDKLFIRGQKVAWDGKLLQDITQSWDGRERYIMPQPTKGTPAGVVIDGNEPSVVDDVNYNLLLGYRAPGAPMALSLWLRLSVKKPKTSLDVSIDRTTGNLLLMVQMSEGKYNHNRLWLDPARGYLPVRYEYRGGIRDWEDKNPANWWWVALDEAKQFGDAWVPMKLTLQSGTRDNMTREVYEAQQFSLEKPAPQDLTFEIPLGIRIVDGIRHQAYEIQKDGSKKFFDVVNNDTGKLVTAKEQAAAEAAATQAATQPTTKPVAK